MSEAPSPLELVTATPAASPAPTVFVEPPVPGEGLLRWLERGSLRLDRLIGRAVPDELNPLLHTGAIAITSLLVATASGVLLLFWYSPSVHHAFDSVAAMSAAPWTSGLVRSVHRYSSDACMFFSLVHALRMFLGRRFGGARWLAWVTGFALVGTLWFVGWTGYWLVWDEPAQRVAVGTARMIDALPMFTDPLGRSFLVDESVSSLLFFVVFFVHMLIPLAMGLLLWLHVTRLSRPQFLTRRPLTLWLLGSLLLLSLVYPADNAEPARMTALGGEFSMDWWYLAPLAITDRLAAGPLWSAWLVSGAMGFGVPWWLGRGRARPARVTPKRCNACEKCFQDCPYHAISMVPRNDGITRHAVQAEVDPLRCVGCGICAGSCDTAGVGLDWFTVSEQRRRVAGWLKEALALGEKPVLAFVCKESAGGQLEVDPETGLCPEMPGYRVLELPCSGWLHPFGLEHFLRYGGQASLVVTCSPGACRYREGALWTEQRMQGEREPALRTEQVSAEQIRLLALDASRGSELIRTARAFRDGEPAPAPRAQRSALTALAAALLAAVFAGGLGVLSDAVYAAPQPAGSELVVSFKHPGQVSEDCRELTPDELARLPVHMRREKVCDRHRTSVRMRVSVDDRRVVDATYPPSGIWGDGSSVAVERVVLQPGEHRVRVSIGDSPDLEDWNHASEKTLTFTDAERRVVLFDKVSGFRWH